MEHTGMHIGGGQIIHCSVNVQTGSVDSSWTHYAIPVGLYDEEDIPTVIVKQTLRKGSNGDLVKNLQETLAKLGYDCGLADGIFGAKTQNAVIAFQKDRGLSADGVVGPKTWAALDTAEPELTYRVSIDNVTWAQYKKILEICPLAEAYKEST